MKNRPELQLDYVFYFVEGFLTADMVKWCTTYQQFVSQHSQTPQIHTDIILQPLHYLWRHVISCTTVGLSPFITKSRPAEISQFADILDMQKSTLAMMIF